MGFRVLLMAVSGKEPATIHQEFGVEPTDQYSGHPDPPVSGALLPGGAYLLHVQDRILPDERVFSRLSKDASLVACYANETVMNSLACSWVDGAEEWSVFHDAQQGTGHLETDGRVPPQLAPIQERLFTAQREQGDADYVFDIPVELFTGLGGIRYDEEIEGAGPVPWQVLTRTRRKRFWWLFG